MNEHGLSITATMAILMFVAITMGRAQNVPIRFEDGHTDTRVIETPGLPSMHGIIDHQDASTGLIQTTSLVSGSNWFSTHVEITLNDLKAALVEALSGTQIVIKSQTQNTSYNGIRWNGQLSSFDVTRMYLITVSTPCEISLQGLPVDPAEHPTSINSGFNWIAYPLTETMSVSTAFNGFAVNGDLIKSQTQNASYINNRWQGVFNLEPGKGYIYKSNVSSDRTFTFPLSTE